MPVKIRLTRVGKKKQPSYRVVVVDSRKPRDGAYIEQIGRYDPRAEPSLVEIDNERALDWLQKGAQPTERAQKLLEISGAWTRFRIDKGDIHTIDDTPAVEPKAVEPQVEEPQVEEPQVEEPQVEEPQVEEPQVEETVEAKVEELAPEAAADEVEEPVAAEPAAEADVEKEDE
ncbi:MAG: 30S ribosomal protein S16 [Actinomycetota bacterium]|nr:30S ribosomal protein S16 [Actinomycetota bacterium]